VGLFELYGRSGQETNILGWLRFKSTHFIGSGPDLPGLPLYTSQDHADIAALRQNLLLYLPTFPRVESKSTKRSAIPSQSPRLRMLLIGEGLYPPQV
jgi:hypothetical protein